MEDKFTSFQFLKEHYRFGIDYQITGVYRGGTILILAPHGGGIEPGTSELARAIAGDELSFYLFEGILPAKNNALHITSHHFDEPQCLKILVNFENALVIHGCRRKESVIYVGGGDNELKKRLYSHLRKKYPIILATTWRYAGQQKMNICNRTKSMRGVQLEFSTGIRKELFANYLTQKGRQVVTSLFTSLIEDIRDVIL
jgi:phage replication-related protein YjqB (UPF0714/DUF867 family)